MERVSAPETLAFFAANYGGRRFRFDLSAFGDRSFTEQTNAIGVMAKFAFLPLGAVCLDRTDPSVLVLVVAHDASRRSQNKSEDCYFFAVQTATGSRHLIDRYDVKKRAYIGTTSMDAELSLVMANMAQVQPGSLACDPFAGTGSLLLTCAEFGAYTVGAEIDGRQMRGGFVFERHDAAKACFYTQTTSLASNVAQYGVSSRMLGSVISDVTRSPFLATAGMSPIELFDAIVTDPPYGVRAGPKKLAAKKAGSGTFTDASHVPAKEAYALEDIVWDLFEFAAQTLRIDAHLVMWWPEIEAEDGVKTEQPSHPAFTLQHRSVQQCGGWRRLLLTFRKTQAYAGPQPPPDARPDATFRARLFAAYPAAN